MRHERALKTTLACTAVTGLSLLGVAAPTAAAPPEEPPGTFLVFERFDDREGPDEVLSKDSVAEFGCEPGPGVSFPVTVEGHFVGTVRERVARDGTIRFHLTVRGTETYSANGHTFTQRFSVNVVERVVENPDGSLFITGQAAGGARYYVDGVLTLRDPGMNRYELRITDPGTDEETFDFTVVKGSTGLNETEGRDFCEDLATFLAP